MRKMRDSGIAWIGVIPQDWEIVRTKSLYCSAKEIAGDRADDFERLALTLNGVIKRSKEDSVGLQPEKFSGYQILKKGELVFKLIVLENVATSRVGLSPYTGIVSPAYIVLSKQSRAKDLVVRYSMYHFLSMWQREVFNQMGDNGVRSSLNAKELLNIPHPFPSIYEQKRIVTFLDAQCAEIDAVLEKTRASIEEYKKLKQAVITQAVTKGIRGDRPMKDSGIEWIGDIPAEWRKTQLRHCAAIKSGITLGKKYEKTDSLVERPYLRVANVQDGYVDLSVLTTIEVTQDEDLKYRLRAGDVLMTEGGDRDKLGRGCVWHGEIEPCLHQNHIFAVQTSKDTLLPEFLEYLTVSDVGRSYFDVTAIKTTNLACTSSSKVLAFTIPLPSVEEQAEIVEALNTKCAGIDALVAKKQQYLTEIENYKKSLIYEYVTGKKEVHPL